MSRKPNTEQRRAEIVTAMIPVIATLGYEKATIQAIAKEAGLAPGLIHYHFTNKQEILVSLVGSMADYARARFEHVGAEAKSAEDQLRAYLKARLGLGDGASPELVAAWVMIGAEAVRQPEVREVYQRIVETELGVLTDLLSACLIMRKRETGSARNLAAGLIAMMEGAFQLSSAAASVMPVNYAADAAIAYALLSIKAAPRMS